MLSPFVPDFSSKLLNNKGIIVIEEPYLGDMIKKTSYDQLYDGYDYDGDGQCDDGDCDDDNDGCQECWEYCY